MNQNMQKLKSVLSSDSSQELMNTFTYVQNYAKAISLSSSISYTRLMATLESIDEGIVTDDMPVGSEKEKINELLRRCITNQTKTVNAVMNKVYTVFKEFSELPNGEDLRKELNALTEKVKLPAKTEHITPYSQMDEHTQQKVLTVLKDRLQLNELPSINLVNGIIDRYNAGASIPVIYGAMNFSLATRSPLAQNFNDRLDEILEPEVLDYLLDRFKELAEFNSKLVKANRYVALLDNLNDYCEDIHAYTTNLLNELVSMNSNTAALEDYETNTGDVLDYSGVKELLKDYHPVKPIAGYVKTKISLMNEYIEKFKETQILDIEEFQNMDVVKIFEISSMYLRVLEDIAITLNAYILLVTVVQRNTAIYSDAINGLILMEEKVTSVLSDLATVSNGGDAVIVDTTSEQTEDKQNGE